MVHQSEVENYPIGQASIEEVSESAYRGAKIVVVGVGGGGSNMIKHLVEYGVHQDVTPIAVNTDGQHLKNNPAPVKILLGKESTGGLGAGGVPDVGRKAAEESANEVREAIKDAKLVIISTGLGGGTGTGATPTIVKIAKEVGALTIAIVTKPFKYEGNQKRKRAEEGLKELEQSSDSILVIPNDKILLTMKKNASTTECYREVDDVLVRAVSGISTIITKPGNINVDFADLKSALGFKGFALMGIGEATGEDAAKAAVESAIQSPLLDDASIEGAKSIIVFFEHHPDYPMMAYSNACDFIQDQAHQDVDVKFGQHTNENIPIDHVRVTIIATGSEKNSNEPALESIATPSQPVVKQTRKVGNGEYLRIPTEDELSIPTTMRIQQD
ncbi:cell division protein FtsZ [Helicobacter pylori]|uniref:cell division protein FtsZ n=1 Tax=Helicobacter pylori TaxID=210 RepID=UPI00165A4A1A|nr:cell division protein FtsZ [Helicobacter pylori]WQS08686.1 cell division protein FtsZ [Helicobacter pylori]WQS13643.1 cell division protein FtsZ [Helicobacter pylori]WQS15005.1 cell division protein FtsZ [Helicobacter pylori]WQS24744.1 cell division protein FtsZ [Helicobacter pylori]